MKTGLDPTLFTSEYHSTGVAAWLNADAGFELATQIGVTLRVAGGVSWGLASNYLIGPPFAPNINHAVRGMLFPQARCSAGYSF